MITLTRVLPSLNYSTVCGLRNEKGPFDLRNRKEKKCACPIHGDTLISFYRAKPATRPATARRLIELPDISCDAPLEEEPVEVEPAAEPVSVPEPDEAPVPVAAAPLAVAVAADSEDAVPSPLTETGPSVAPGVPEMIVPEGFWPGGEVLLDVKAAFWKASKLLFAVGLIAKTIPLWQCVKLAVVWEQKNHKGAEAFSTVILQVGKPEAPVGSDTFWNPELTPAAVQGAVKVDCTTEWFFETNWKLTMSPLATPDKVVGLKTRLLLSPTRTL
jgi:hypothetical protein